MNLLAPAALAFGATIPVVVLFYLLKRKRVVKLVPSTLLWQRFLSESQASAPFQKLRHNWLLVLQVLLLLALILALSRPYFAGQVLGGRLLVTILDASASMQSTDESPNRFGKARREALALVDTLHDTDQMVVLLAAAHTEVKQSPTSNKSALRRALQSCETTDAPTRLAEALKLAQPLVKDRTDAEIHLFSDGAAPDLRDFEHEGLNVVYHRVGVRASNAGVVGLDVRAHPEEPERRAIFASVLNAGTNAVEADLELRLNDQLLETRTVKIGPRETVPLVFSAAQTNDAIWTVRLGLADDLAADNQASVPGLMPRPAHILLVSRGNRFLERALAATPGTQLSVVPELNALMPEFDLTVIDEVLPAVWPEGNLLAIRVAATNWMETLGRLEAPPIVDWKNTHPLLRFVTFDNVQIAEAVGARLPLWATSLVDAPGSPLILAGELGPQRIVWLGFSLLESTWPLRVSFPIFMANAIEWLNPASSLASQFIVQSGEPLRLPLTSFLTNGVCQLPGGQQREVEVAPGARELVFGQTIRQGIYEVSAGTNRASFCVNLLDAAESDTTPRAEIRFGKYAVARATTVRRANLELWRWIAAAGLAVLLLEWWFYHRRTA